MKQKNKHGLCLFLIVMLSVVQVSAPQLVSAEKQYVKQLIYSQDFNDASKVNWTDALYAAAPKTAGEWCFHGRTPHFEEHTNADDKCIALDESGYTVVTLANELTKSGSGLYEIDVDICAGTNNGDFGLYLVSGTNPAVAYNCPTGQWTTFKMTIDLNEKTWYVNDTDTYVGYMMGDTIKTLQFLTGGNNGKFDNFKIYELTENPDYDIYDSVITLTDKNNVVQYDLEKVDIKLGKITIDFGESGIDETTVTDENVFVDGDISYKAMAEDNLLIIIVTSQRLEFDTLYTLTLDGLKTAEGKTVTKKEFSFKTIENKPIISDGAYVEYEDFEDWTNATCGEHYSDAYITLGGFRTWTGVGIVSGKNGGNALTPMNGAAQASRGLQYYFVPKLERDNFTIEYDYYTGDIDNFSGMTLGVYRTKDGYGMNMIPYEGMTALGTKTWGHVTIDFATGTGAWTVKITNDLDEDVYNNSGTWTDSTVNLFEWVFNSIDVSKNNADVNVPKIDNFIVNAIYLSAPKLSPKSVSVYEGDIIQPLDSVSPSSNRIIVDFGQRMMPDDMTKGNIYITESDDPNPVTTTDRYSNGKYELSPIDYLKAEKKYTVHINKCRNVNDMEMSQDYSIDFTVGKGTVSTEMFDILQNGSAIDSVSKLSPGNASLQILYNNSTGEKYLLHYILAFYKGNELVYSKYDTAELGDNSAGQIEEINVLIPEMAEEYDEADIIALDSFNGMLPISKALVLK